MRPWIHNQGLSYSLNDAADELVTIDRLAPGSYGRDDYLTALRALTAQCNAQLFRLVEESLLAFEQGDQPKSVSWTDDIVVPRWLLNLYARIHGG